MTPVASFLITVVILLYKGGIGMRRGGKRGKKGEYSGGSIESGVPPATGATLSVVLGIDPGLSGAFVITDGNSYLRSYPMPLKISGKEKSIPFGEVLALLSKLQWDHGRFPVFLERAVSFGMGTKAAFNYGRGFEAIMIAIANQELPLTLVEPGKWTKEMHEGISSDMKPKVKSAIAVDRLYPQLVGLLPRRPKGGFLDGPVDALLIAGYGLRRLNQFLMIGGNGSGGNFY